MIFLDINKSVYCDQSSWARKPTETGHLKKMINIGIVLAKLNLFGSETWLHGAGIQQIPFNYSK